MSEIDCEFSNKKLNEKNIDIEEKILIVLLKILEKANSYDFIKKMSLCNNYELNKEGNIVSNRIIKEFSDWEHNLETINNTDINNTTNASLLEKPSFKDELNLYLKKSNINDLGIHSQLDPLEIKFIKTFISKKKIKTVAEVGFNAGHLADTILMTNENITLVTFDIATSSYTPIIKEYIDEKYPGRHTMIQGDSRRTIPNYYQQNPDKKFDLIFIHGGHYGNIPKTDLMNCRLLSKKNTIVVMNNVNFENVETYNIKSNEAWELFIKNNYIDEIKKKGFSPSKWLVYGKYNLCDIYICSLLRSDRMQFIEENQKMFPFIKTFKSVNGYDTKETLQEIDKLNLKYVNLDNNFRTYGTLANWITKYKMLKYQVDNEIPFLCFLEDDVILENNFYTFICDSLKHFNTNVNILRLMTWGEGYITSYESAKRLLEHLNRDGIVRNIDNQLREYCGYEIALEKTPMKLMILGNDGDCLKTSKFENADIHKKLQLLKNNKD